MVAAGVALREMGYRTPAVFLENGTLRYTSQSHPYTSAVS